LQTICRTLDTLEALGNASTPVGVTELASQLGLPKANVYRMLHTLESRGYVAQDPRDAKYSLGIRCFELGVQVTYSQALRAVASPHLRSLSETTEEIVHLALYSTGGEVVYVEKIESLLPVAPKSQVGLRAPAFCVATGRALLAYQPMAEIESVLSSPLPRFTSHTINDPDELRALLEKVRAEGYATNKCSWREGVCGVAAPMRNHSGAVIASVGLCVPESRFSPSRVRFLTGKTLEAATAISVDLGFVAPPSVAGSLPTADREAAKQSSPTRREE
jgi:DNA-binding IclR family transcriptional regulator